MEEQWHDLETAVDRIFMESDQRYHAIFNRILDTVLQNTVEVTPVE